MRWPNSRPGLRNDPGGSVEVSRQPRVIGGAKRCSRRSAIGMLDNLYTDDLDWKWAVWGLRNAVSGEPSHPSSRSSTRPSTCRPRRIARARALLHASADTSGRGARAPQKLALCAICGPALPRETSVVRTTRSKAPLRRGVMRFGQAVVRWQPLALGAQWCPNRNEPLLSMSPRRFARAAIWQDVGACA